MDFKQENKSLRSQLTDLHRRKKVTDIANVLIKAFYLATGWLLLLHLADWIFILPASVRSILSYATLAALLGFIMYVLIIILRAVDHRQTALDIENSISEFKQDISTATQFATENECRENYSAQLIGDLILRVEKSLDDFKDKNIFPLKPLPYGRPAAYALGILIIVCAFSPGELSISFKRYLSPDGIIGDWGDGDIVPGDIRVAKGADLEIEMKKSAQARAKVEWKGDQDIQEGMIAKGSTSMAIADEKLTAVIKDINISFFYRILLGRRQSRFYRVDCYNSLLLSDIRLKITPPRYTGFQIRRTENQGDITAIRGSRVDISAVSSLPLDQSGLALERSGPRDVVITDGRQLSGSFYVGKNEKYCLWGRTTQGDTFVNRASITCLEDSPPEMEIIRPDDEIMLGEDMMVPLIGKAADDFGLSAIRLGYIINGQQNHHQIGQWQKGPADTVVEYPWNAGRLDLMPGDSVIYWLEALDNDDISGPKVGRSRRQMLRVPTIEDIYRSLAKADSAIIDEIGRTEQPSDQLKEEIEKLSQSLKEVRKIDWQQQAATEQVLKKQQELTEQLERAMEQASENLKEREDRWSFDQETMEKLAQLREMFDQIATDQMRQDMERLRQALDKLDKQEVSRALENLKLSQDDFKRQLDQTMEILKELQQEQHMEKLDRQLQDMIRQQQDLKARTEKADKMDNKKLSSEQNELGEDFNKITSEMQDLSRELTEMNREASSRLKENAGQMQQNQTGKKMRKASEALSEDKNQKASELQKQILSDLSIASAGLQSARSSMRQAKNQAAAKAIQQRASDLLDLSRQQENLNQSANNAGSDRNDLANQQQIIRRQAERIRQELDNMARNNMLLSPRPQQMMQEAARQMEQTAQAHSDGRSGEARQGAQKIMASLNGAAISLMESSSGSGSGSGDMMQDMAGLSGQQQSINDGTGAMLSLPREGGGQLSLQARSKMSRLAAQQEAVRQGMEEFNEKYGGRRDKAGRLDDLVEDMKQVIGDLKKQQVNRRTIERQEKILTRMLEVQQSLKERDFSRERKVERGQLPEGARYPTNIDQTKRNSQGLPAWRDWRKEYYPLEYKDILENYFRSLGQ